MHHRNHVALQNRNRVAIQKESGVVEAASLLPIRSWQRFLIESSAYLVVVFVSIALVSAYVFIVYRDIAFRGNVLLFAATLIVSYFAFVSIAKLIASLRFSARTLQLIGSTAFFLLLFTSGVVIPAESLPDLISWFTPISPMQVVYKSLESIWNNTLNFGTYGLHMAELVGIIVLFNFATRILLRRRVS